MSSVALTQAPPLPCSISVTEVTPGLDSVSLKVVTPGENCSFTLISLDSGEDGSECRRAIEVTAGRRRGGSHQGSSGLQVQGGEGEEAGFICMMDHLEPGISYLLQIRSQKDDQVENVTMATSKFRPHHCSTFYSYVTMLAYRTLGHRTLQRTWNCSTRVPPEALIYLERELLLLTVWTRPELFRENRTLRWFQELSDPPSVCWRFNEGEAGRADGTNMVV